MKVGVVAVAVYADQAQSIQQHQVVGVLATLPALSPTRGITPCQIPQTLPHGAAVVAVQPLHGIAVAAPVSVPQYMVVGRGVKVS